MSFNLINENKPFMIAVSEISTNHKTGEWCRLPYPGHKDGCPNYGKAGCPPDTASYDSVIDRNKQMFIIFSEFNLIRHVERMEDIHPNWSERQKRNVLYWQETARKELRRKVILARQMTGCDVAMFRPEAYGVNVYLTCLHHGLCLERIRDLKTCRHIALIGYRKESYDK